MGISKLPLRFQSSPQRGATLKDTYCIDKFSYGRIIEEKKYSTWRTDQYLCKNVSSDHKFTGFDSDIRTESWTYYKVAPVYGTPIDTVESYLL